MGLKVAERNQKIMKAVAVTVRGVELGEYNTMSGGLTQESDPEFAGFKVRGMQDKFLMK